jgi:hypothetical protein
MEILSVVISAVSRAVNDIKMEVLQEMEKL